MLTITNLTSEKTLAADELRDVRGGYYLPTVPSTFFGIANTPKIDAGAHFLAQGQEALINQAGNLGGFNVVDSDQTQVGVSGQVAF